MRIEHKRNLPRNRQTAEYFCYRDKVACIKAIEDNDVRTLERVRLVKDSKNAVGCMIETHSISIRKYVIELRTNISFVFIDATIKFVYDKRTGFGEIQMPKMSFNALLQAYMNEEIEPQPEVIAGYTLAAASD